MKPKGEFQLTVERAMTAAPKTLYRAWTERFDVWFAVPETVRMEAKAGAPFFFETQFEGERHPHYGRFLRLEEDKLVELTRLTWATKGLETVVTIELARNGTGTDLRLTHKGFPDEESRDGHRVWAGILADLDKRLAA